MKSLIYILTTFLLLLHFSSCKQDKDLLMYQNDPGIYFYSRTNSRPGDSIIYNFILAPLEQIKDTVYLPLRIMGDPATYDRAVQLLVADSSTAKEGVDFTFGPKIVRAGHFTDSIQVYVLRKSEMQTQVKRLYVVIQQSKDFKPGYDDFRKFTVAITDQVLPPTWTYSLNVTFGAFSMVKFRFMVTTLKRTNYAGILPSEMAAMASKCKVALAEYEETNGPLLDENGIRIVFP
ncbi:DUF4843 domain-containing protein [Chitinophaga silvatica]|uniref:DUF4843 domain-containing protein n=1 Tax=Chitinophaga silvatica TaxID=2282649 RepID=A0A3E1Y6W3_9BACT|nr:DUF4843 domain-containing protein [Chitinophaga silvatica]RFS20684.1 DUF4843 domain-containing protein [Chitinophaga silvatica]